MTDNDVLINPYWTAPPERNKGLAKQIIHTMVMDGDTKWNRCFAVVKTTMLHPFNVWKRLDFGVQDTQRKECGHIN